MKLLSENKFSKVYKEEETSTIEWHWENENGDMTIEEYKEEMLIFLNTIESRKPLNTLVDTRTFALVIAPELQEWVDKNISIKINKIIDKLAFVLPEDIFTQVSIQQAIDEEEGQNYNNVSYFESIDKARAWFIK